MMGEKGASRVSKTSCCRAGCLSSQSSVLLPRLPFEDIVKGEESCYDISQGAMNSLGGVEEKFGCKWQRVSDYGQLPMPRLY